MKINPKSKLIGQYQRPVEELVGTQPTEVRLYGVRQDKLEAFMPPRTPRTASTQVEDRIDGTKYTIRIVSQPGSKVDDLTLIDHFKDYIGKINIDRQEPITYVESTVRL